MARFCDGPHIEHARWRTKVDRSSSGQTSTGWCDECKAKELAREGTKLKEEDFIPIIPVVKEQDMNQKGFTLVELMIVVAIVGVLAAIAIPKFADMRAESYKKKHGRYPDGYRTPAQREADCQTCVRNRDAQRVQVVNGTVDYIYDPKTKLCFAHYQSGSLVVVPCDTVLPILTPTAEPGRSY